MPGAPSSLAVQLGGVGINLAVSQAGGCYTVSILVDRPATVVVTTGPAPGASPPSPLRERPGGGTPERPTTEHPLQAASAAAATSLPLRVAALESRLRSLGGFSPLQRLERAFAAGEQDGAGIPIAAAGGRFYQALIPRIPGASNLVYAVLRPSGGGAARTTRNKEEYRTLCWRDGSLAPDSISRAFATEAEAQAYVAGAEQVDESA